jgi:hypothetical protein
MSIEPEDMLEEALRGDLPTPDAEARVRRRLLAAGIAVGNGMAATTAAASGAGMASVAVKATGLSWGLKLGFAALVGIPTVGLWLDGRTQSSSAAPSRVVAPAQPVAAKPRATAPATPDAPALATPAEPAAVVEHPPARTAKAPANDAPTPVDAIQSSAQPSQADFTASEQPAHAPQERSTLAEETRLLDAAFAALTAGDRAQAASLLHEHDRRFPAGLLRKERERAKTRLNELSRGE